jgi:hypothetical protein
MRRNSPEHPPSKPSGLESRPWRKHPWQGTSKENRMKALIGNQVQTDYSNYAFKSREEAEAFYFAARERAVQKTPDVRAKPQPAAKRKK